MNDRFAVRWTGQIYIEQAGNFHDYVDTSSFSRIPSFVDGNFLHNAAAAGGAGQVVPVQGFGATVTRLDTGIGDFNRDGREDFAVANNSEVRIYAGSSGLAGPSLLATVTGSFGSFASQVRVYNAGDVDGDGTTDLLAVGGGSGYVIFGSDLLTGTVTLSDLLDSDGAIDLPDDEFRPIGDFDGDGAADLGAGLMLVSNRLDERTTLEH